MGALTNTKIKPTEFCGTKKLLYFDSLSIATASDTMTLSLADNNVSTIYSVMVCPSGGQDAAFTAVQATFSDLEITITSVEQDGSAATNFTGTKVNLWVICS